MTAARREAAALTSKPADRPGVLSGSRRFAAVRAWRSQRTCGVVRVAAAPNPVGVVRLGIAVSGVPSAVVRNRVRRRLREATRATLLAHPGLDFIISAGAPAATVAYTTLVDDAGRGINAAAALVTRRLAIPVDAGGGTA